MPSQTEEKRWPFDDWLRLAVRRYGLTPSEFWAMSLRDWRVLNKGQMGLPCVRAEFEALAAEYPDNGEKVNHAD